MSKVVASAVILVEVAAVVIAIWAFSSLCLLAMGAG